MNLRRTLPLIGIMFMLAGCFRQADDSFDTVGSVNTGETSITQDALTDANITIIDPEATESTEADATATLRIVQATETDAQTVDATEVPTSTSQAIPTATEATFVTPEIVEVVEQPTSAPTDAVNQPTLQPTPTGVAPSVVGDCQYEVQSGDNLFRIALNNSVSLDALLATNGLTEASVIQPGQILTLPDCVDDGTGSTTVELVPTVVTPLVLDDCDYEIQAGDTLFNIALEFEVTLADLLAENELTEESIIQPGDILTLPNCEDADTQSTIIATETISETGEVIHIVEAGDSLLSIAREYGVTVNELLQANNIPNPNNLTEGQQIIIPSDDE